VAEGLRRIGAASAFLVALAVPGTASAADLIGRASVIDGSEQIVGIAVIPW
jgi:hypothetical protein